MSALEQVDTLLRESCGPVPSPVAWNTLVQVIADNFPESPHAVLALRISGLLDHLDEEQRLQALENLAGFLRNSPWRHDLFEVLGESRAELGQATALAIAQPEDLADASRRTLLKALVATRRFPAKLQAGVLARLAGTTGRSDEFEELVDSYLSVRNHVRRRRRLNRLHKLLADKNILADRIRQAQASLQVSCPRCHIRLTQPSMIRHLLTKHALVLEGKRVRNAWRVVDQWLINYRQTGDQLWLRRCFELVAQMEDPGATLRLQQRMVLQKVARNAVLRRLLIAAVASQKALCPHCFSQSPVLPSHYIEPVMRSHGLLSRQGYRVHLRDDLPIPHLEIETPLGLVYSGPESGRWLTQQGIILVAALPLAVLAVVLALVGVPAVVVVVTLLLACSAYGWSWLREQLEPACADRAVDIAWTMLCPQLLSRGLTDADAEFLAALALGSVGAGSPERRAHWLEQLRDERDQSFVDGRAPSTQLACLTRLGLSDAAAQQVDLAALTASALARCWKGRLPLAFAQQLLDDWRSVLWTRGCTARLRILLLDQAFGEGWEIVNLLGLRERVPALASVLELGNTKPLAELRWLWSARAAAPWLNISPSRACFEIARDASSERTIFERHPDLLFLENQPDGLAICSSGVYWRHLRFIDTPRQVRITERVAEARRTYTLHVGGETVPVHYDPADLVERLDRWLGFLQEDFQKKARKARRWVPTSGVRFLPPGEFATCPECQQKFVGTAGQVGSKLETDAV
ncbi:hypothetical protein BH10PLA2_BH10PLA2_25730 [soil metagenome]